MILEMDDKGRKRISGGLNHTRRKTERDGQPHNMTLVFHDDFAITICAVPYGDRHALGRDLANYGPYRINASGLRRWVGFGVVAGSPHRLHSLVIILDPSRLDDERSDTVATGGAAAQPDGPSWIPPATTRYPTSRSCQPGRSS